ncbi:MAG: hypothetical protein FWF12_09025 [Betaproteobacteria bacterium]|nr:hypothetical protein [Betaproteobacteria bacterium]
MTLKTPTNALELIENLHVALRNCLVFDEAFYTEEGFRGITAAERIRIYHDQGKQTLDIGAGGFQAFLANGQKPSEEGLSISVMLKTRSDGKKNVSIYGNIRRDHPALYYLDVEKLIEKLTGHIWQVRLRGPLGSRQIQREQTDPYGNAEREYIYQEGDIEEIGSFSFGPDGFLEHFFLLRYE